MATLEKENNKNKNSENSYEDVSVIIHLCLFI